MLSLILVLIFVVVDFKAINFVNLIDNNLGSKSKFSIGMRAWFTIFELISLVRSLTLVVTKQS